MKGIVCLCTHAHMQGSTDPLVCPFTVSEISRLWNGNTFSLFINVLSSFFYHRCEIVNDISYMYKLCNVRDLIECVLMMVRRLEWVGIVSLAEKCLASQVLSDLWTGPKFVDPCVCVCMCVCVCACAFPCPKNVFASTLTVGCSLTAKTYTITCLTFVLWQV
jgi:hypothetical protein